ncbi:Imm8 family immunity protein [Paenibacillus sp. PK3_47]|uniref:Imm8 family immunity protein n=1 Tax=Paenibacillus sp. PK3_47 TaxID=2072642 RepID=UPI00201D9C6D|nr:Imm8 family immunity protein [Paenibacillus sp. PK3_47]
MIRPILKETHFYEMPEENKDFCVSVVLDVGSEKVHGADQFYATLATANGLKAFFTDEAAIAIRGLLLVKSFDISLIKAEIQKILDRCSKDTWEETAVSINRFFPWEFDESKWK